MFTSIVLSAAEHVKKMLGSMLLKPLPSTGLPPFLMVTADKATINRRSSQATLILATIDGERRYIPAGSPLVYAGEEGGLAEELINKMLKTITDCLCIPESHLQMIAG